MPEISVIVPVYKVEAYLHRCVDSILAQTFADFELILVDDGSPDNCGKTCEEYAIKDERILVIHQKNQGVSVARNRGVRASTGKYITFVDSDDWIAPYFLESLLSVIQQNNADICVSKLQEVSSEDEAKGFITDSVRLVDNRTAIEILGQENKSRFRAVHEKLFRREIVLDTPFPEGRAWAEDAAVVYKWYYAANRIALIEDELYFYFNNPDNITNSGNTSAKLGSIETTLELLDFFNKEQFEKLYRKFSQKFLWTLQDLYRSLDSNEIESKERVKQLIRETLTKNKKRCGFSKENNPGAYEVLYPRLMNYYWKWKAFQSRINERCHK